MKLPQKVKDLRSQFIAKMGLPSGSEDNFRTWCGQFAQQLDFSFPGEGWGQKSNGSSAPLSKDTIAQKMGNSIFAWDLFTGSGTGVANLVDDPDSMNVSDQTFRPVTAKDWIGGGVPTPGNGGNGNPPAPVTDLKPVLDALATLNARTDTNTQAVRQLFDIVQNLPANQVDYERIRAEIKADVNQLLSDHEVNIKNIVATTPVRIGRIF